MGTWDDKLRQEVVQAVEVSKQLVAAAQSFFMGTIGTRADVAGLLSQLLQHYEAEWPKKVILDSRGDNAAVLGGLARAMSIKLAGVEAIWKLIHRGQLLPASSSQKNICVSVGWTTESRGSGWNFEEFEISHPVNVIRAFSVGESEILCNHDLFIHELGIDNMSEMVKQSLRDAVECFAAELYTPCAAMLGSASEGAWLEFGYLLSDYCSSADATRSADLKKNLANPFDSIAKKIDLVFKQYSNESLFGRLWDEYGIRPKDLQHIMVWSDTVRDSRNSIHYGVDPRTPNSREKLAALLLGAIPFFRTLYAVRSAVAQ